MLLDIINAGYINDFKIKVKFENGEEGIIDFKEYLQKGGVFKRLKDKKYFKSYKRRTGWAS